MPKSDPVIMKVQRPPYVLDGDRFAAIFGRTKSWLYRLNSEDKKNGTSLAPPRCKVKELCYNTRDPKLRAWVEERLGPIDWDRFNEI